jgi:hypothetical protein
MYGNARMSYQDLGENTRLVVKHSQPVNLDLAAGRTMHIESIYVENSQGERFKYPYNHLAGAQAMQRHVANSGRPYDDAGTAIIQMSEQISQLATFKRQNRILTLQLLIILQLLQIVQLQLRRIPLLLISKQQNHQLMIIKNQIQIFQKPLLRRDTLMMGLQK